MSTPQKASCSGFSNSTVKVNLYAVDRIDQKSWTYASSHGAVVQALASPMSGFLGDSFDRVYIVVAGTVLWGAMTAAIGASRTLPEARCGT